MMLATILPLGNSVTLWGIKGDFRGQLRLISRFVTTVRYSVRTKISIYSNFRALDRCSLKIGIDLGTTNSLSKLGLSG